MARKAPNTKTEREEDESTCQQPRPKGSCNRHSCIQLYKLTPWSLTSSAPAIPVLEKKKGIVIEHMAPGTPFLPTITDEKTLRPSFIRDEDERPKVAYNQFSDDIPVISLAGIDGEEGAGGEKRKEICHKIVAACEDWGVFQVVDHGVDAELILEMTRLSKEFFVLPPEEKLRFDMSGGKKGGFIVSSHLQVVFGYCS